MNKIVNFSKLSQGSLATLANDVLVALDQSLIAALATLPVKVKLQQSYSTYLANLLRSRKNAYRALCDNKWIEVNEAFKGLSLSVKLLSISFDREKMKSGKAIIERITQLGNRLYNQKQSQRVPYLKSIIVELARPEFASLEELTPWANHLTALVAEYEELCQSKKDDFMELKAGASATAFSPELIAVLSEMIEYVYGMSVTAATPEWKQLYEQVCDRCEVAKRSSGKRNSSDSESNTPSTPEA